MIHLLIDGDLLAYSTATAVETAIEWEPGYWTWHCDEWTVKQVIENHIEEASDIVGASKVTLCLSDDTHSFRKEILPSYKENRAGLKRPLVLKSIKEWMLDDLEALSVPSLEADDVMGIVHSKPSKTPTVCLSLDKDMRSIPGLYLRRLGDEIEDISEETADQNHMYQTLIGDVADGYSGCPGVGSTRAWKCVTERIGPEQYDHEVLRGKRKGEVETRVRDIEYPTIWDAAEAYFLCAGLSTDDFLTQARVARILRYKDYDFKQKEVKLWNKPLRESL